MQLCSLISPAQEATKQILWFIWLCIAISLLYPNLITVSNGQPEFCDVEDTLQAEEGMSSMRLIECNLGSFQTPCFQHRSTASGSRYKLTVYFTRVGQYISYKITSPSQCKMRIINVLYSNDEGGADTISTLLDDMIVGQFITHQNKGNGNLWNVFNSSGRIGDIHTISPGDHWLTLKVSETDSKGVELDKITVSFEQCHGGCPIVSAVPPAIGDDDNVDEDNDSLSDEEIIGIVYSTAIFVLTLVAILTGITFCYVKHKNNC